MRSKKSSFAPIKMFVYIIYSFMIVVALGTFVTTLTRASGSINQLDENIPDHILITRVISSPECFAYSDWTGRVYDRIDLSRFDDDVLEYCIDLESFGYEMRFILRHSGSEDSVEAVTGRWFGDYSYDSVEMPVLVEDSGERYPGILTIEYQTRPDRR